MDSNSDNSLEFSSPWGVPPAPGARTSAGHCSRPPLHRPRGRPEVTDESAGSLWEIYGKSMGTRGLGDGRFLGQRISPGIIWGYRIISEYWDNSGIIVQIVFEIISGMEEYLRVSKNGSQMVCL